MTAEKKPLRVDVISDCVCPWCYVGKRNLDEAIARSEDRFDMEVHWHPFQLNPDLPAEGRDWKKYAAERFGSLERLRGMQVRLEEVGKAAGIDFAFDKVSRAVNTFEAHRLIALAGLEGLQDEVAEGLFRANFVDGADIGSRETLLKVATAAGMDAERTSAMLESGEGEEQVRQGLEMARRIGVTGVPFFIVDGKYAVSGAQPPEALVELFDHAAQGGGDEG
ncbi:DsbA family oxidoreductase [Vulgatibacter incomptus]|nr:DsbA family oxidoreductase [Vulgatibacter incomptus]